MERKYYRLPAINTEYINRKDYFLLFETGLSDRDNFTSYIFTDPVAVIKVNRYKDVEEAFDKVERYSKRYYLAGYFSYELGYYFEKKLFKVRPVSSYPLIHLCIFDKAISFNHKTGKLNMDIPGLFREKEHREEFRVKNLRINFKKPEYTRKISRIKEYIRKGSTYQVNFTGKYYFDFSGLPFSFYNDLKNRQNVPYAAFCRFKEEYVISLSPELYFKREGLKIYSQPMKGTIKRGKNIEEDGIRALALKESIKDRAENLMIVDLIRNDLGRISKTGSVKVTRIFNIEKYNTLFQMTSRVSGRLREDITYADIFRSIFPGGSVTGAPKIRTMQIIRELENKPRNIYCGALGIIFPKDKAIFNLPIRTISLIRNKGEMGVGGGIVIDSHPEAEYEECLLKGRFLTDRYKPFRLIETILWDGQYRFLDGHLKRMQDSADYFDFYFNPRDLISSLGNVRRNFDEGYKYKVRLLLDKQGNLKIDYSKMVQYALAEDKRIIISKHRIDPEGIFWYHKTTNRTLYDAEYNYYHSKGYFDVIFLNTRGEVTEGAISNIVIKKNNKYYTPAVSSGLLPGIFRQYLIDKHDAQEKILYLKDLINADKTFLCNSVRGLTEVKLK